MEFCPRVIRTEHRRVKNKQVKKVHEIVECNMCTSSAGKMTFILQRTITFNAACQMGGGVQGRLAIKQKLILTCTARAQAAALTGKLD